MSRIQIKARYWGALLVMGAMAAFMTVALPAVTARGADHLDAPLVQADGRIDINDVYAFSSGSNTVLVMTVNPLAGVLSPTALKPGAAYEFAIDNNGDAEEDVVYRVKSSAPTNGSGVQNINLHRIAGEKAERIAKGKSENTISVDGGGSLYVGLRDDPFYFDFVAFQSGLSFCTTKPQKDTPDFFAGLNVTAIVLEVPTSGLLGASSNIGVWARTVVDGQQVERMGRPVINTALIPSGSKDAFNATQPADDVSTWTGAVQASLFSLNGDAGYSAIIAGVLLPDILTYDTSVDASYLNGRGLADDVGDVTLSVVSQGAIPSDCVDANDVAFSNSFPFLADPH